jgi:hypothetical protein
MEERCCRRCAEPHLPLSGGGALSSGSLSTPALGSGSSRGARGGSPVGTISVPGAASGGSSLRGESSTSGGAGNLPLAGEASLNGARADLVSAGDLGLLNAGGVLVLLSLGVAVEVQIGHDVPFGLAAGEGAAEAEDLTGEHPPDETNGVTALVVGGDGNVNVGGGGVGVAKGLHRLASTPTIVDSGATYDDGDVDVGSLLDSLSVGAGVGDDDQARFAERAGDVVGEVTGGETTGNGDSTSVVGELEDRTLAVGTGRDNAD